MLKKHDCQICKAFTPAQVQLATPTYKSRKERGEQKKSEVSSDATPILVDPSEVTLLGQKGRGKASNFTQKPAKGSKKSK